MVKRKTPESESVEETKQVKAKSNNVLVFLIADESTPQDVETVYGLEPAKRMLTDKILLPCRAPQHYRIAQSDVQKVLGNTWEQMGTRRVSHVLGLYGARQSGKTLLLRRFCSTHKINLVVVQYSQFNLSEDLDFAYSTAAQNIPCVVLFDECEGYFHPNAIAPSGALSSKLQEIEDRNTLIWTVFSSTVVQGPECFNLSVACFIQDVVWIGELSHADRLRCLKAAINEHLFPGQNFPLSDSELGVFASLSKHQTAGEIFRWVRSVFQNSLSSKGMGIITYDQSDNVLIPTAAEFTAHLIAPSKGDATTRRLTNHDPKIRNVQPYTNYADWSDT